MQYLRIHPQSGPSSWCMAIPSYSFGISKKLDADMCRKTFSIFTKSIFHKKFQNIFSMSVHRPRNKQSRFKFYWEKSTISVWSFSVPQENYWMNKKLTKKNYTNEVNQPNFLFPLNLKWMKN